MMLRVLCVSVEFDQLTVWHAGGGGIRSGDMLCY